jgi:signal transduction histidine kinase
LSLRLKLFVSSAVILLLLLGFIFIAVELRVRRQVLADKKAELTRTEAAFREHWENLRQSLQREGAIVADAPKLKAAVDTADPATVEPVAVFYRELIAVDFFQLSDSSGRLLSHYESEPGGAYLKLDFPLAVGQSLLGRLTIGHRLDGVFAARLKRLVDAEVALFRGAELLAATLPAGRAEELARAPRERTVSEPWALRLGGESYLAVTAGAPGETAFEFVVLRSLDEELRFLSAVRRDLILLGVLATGLALGASYVTARTLTRPLAAIVDGMREVARSGDLTREIRLESRDVEATLLATSFNQLARSLLAFQREAEQKERLTSLGRLSATLAHEVRNPLTIIKGSALQLLEERSASAEAREAASDILQEVDRLDRLVAAVLDSAKPAFFRLEETDINALCREALAAVNGEPAVAVELDCDPAIERARMDPERLRQVLLNIVLNARQAIRGQGTIRLVTSRDGEFYTIRVSDTGQGIPEGDLPYVFDPFFTRKDSGTGLGLSVAQNIVRGLGGQIAIRSTVGRGTEVDLRLPFDPQSGSEGPD